MKNTNLRKIKLGLLFILPMVSAMVACSGGQSDIAQPLPAGFSQQHALSDCLWQGPVGTAQGEVNEAYPDAGATYWSATFQVPAGARVFLKGQFPYSRYMSFNSYRTDDSPATSLTDVNIAPDSGSTNPFIPGAARYAPARNYTVEISPVATPTTAAGNTLYADSSYGQTVSVWYRVYAPDHGADATGGVGLPQLEVQNADGSIVTGAQACSALVSAQAVPAAPLIPAATYASLRGQTGKPTGFPALNPAVWMAEYNTQYALQCIFLGECGGNPVRQVSFFANLDNAYVYALISRQLGPVVVLHGKMPTTPHTYNNAQVMGTGQMRYWSMCTNEFYSEKATSCAYDEQVPVDANGYYTIVISRAADRPSNATQACGSAFLTWSDAGDGDGNVDDGLVIMRNMLPSPDFADAIQNTTTPGDESSVIGPYLPAITYTTTAAYEALGCR